MSSTDSKRFYTYLHFRKDTMQVFYVGKGRAGRSAWQYGRSQHWARVAEKHGYVAEIAAEWPTEREAFEHEVFLIDTFRLLGHPLVNHTNGGDGLAGHRHSDESRAKMSNSAKGRVISQNARKKISAASAAKWADPEYREKIRIAMLAVSSSDEYRLKLSAASKANWRDEKYRSSITEKFNAARTTNEYKAKHAAGVKRAQQDPSIQARRTASLKKHYESETARDRMTDIRRAFGATPEFKKKVSESMRASHARPEVKKKISEKSLAAWSSPVSRAKRCKSVRHINTGIVYESQSAAARALGVRQSDISAVCTGRVRQMLGQQFEFVGAAAAEYFA